MKFYDCATAPSPRRVRIFLAEKGVTIPTVQVDLRNGEQFTESFHAINPDCTVPVLQLDDGSIITDMVAICAYIEELHPEPALVGATPEARAAVMSLTRQIERDGFSPRWTAFRNWTRGLKGRALPGRTTMSRSRSSPSAAARASRTSCAIRMRGLPAASLSRAAAIASRTSPRWCVVDFAGWAKLAVPGGVRQSAPLVCGCVGKAERESLDAALRQISWPCPSPQLRCIPRVRRETTLQS